MGNLGDSALARGDGPVAAEAYLDAVVAYDEGRLAWFVLSRLESLANALVASREPGRAARAYGLVDAWLADLAMPPHPVTHPARAPFEAQARDALGAAAFEEAVLAGGNMPRTIAAARELAAAGPEAATVDSGQGPGLPGRTSTA